MSDTWLDQWQMPTGWVRQGDRIINRSQISSLGIEKVGDLQDPRYAGWFTLGGGDRQYLPVVHGLPSDAWDSLLHWAVKP